MWYSAFRIQQRALFAYRFVLERLPLESDRSDAMSQGDKRPIDWCAVEGSISLVSIVPLELLRRPTEEPAMALSILPTIRRPLPVNCLSFR